MTKFDKYIGLEYKHQGRGWDGVDCYGLVYLMFKEERGIVLPHFLEHAYPLDWAKMGRQDIVEGMDEVVDWAKGHITYVRKPWSKNLILYDVIFFFATGDCIVANHMGVYIGNNRFIHINSKIKSMVSRFDGWEHKVHGVLRYSG